MYSPTAPRRGFAAPPEIWTDGRRIDWPSWTAEQRAAGWPPRAREALRLALVPAEKLTIVALWAAAARGEL